MEFKKVYISPQTFAQKLKDASTITDLEKRKDAINAIQQSIDSENASITTDIDALNKEILKQKEAVQKTGVSYVNTMTEKNGSTTIIEDYKSVYELTYVNNITMVLGTIGLITFIVKNWN